MKQGTLASIFLLSFLPSYFAFTQQQICSPTARSVRLHASIVSSIIDWKPYAQPRFDEFTEFIVGPWVPKLQSISDDNVSKYEVEEVMRSCGGAVQGIRELPTHLMFPDLDEDEERAYHNRADGGFVYRNDGTYSAGPELFDFRQAEMTSKLLMASFTFGRHRIWLTSSLTAVCEAWKQCSTDANSDCAEIALNSQHLVLKRPTSTDLPDIQQENFHSEITWQSVTRVKMPNPSDTWSLPRAKWENALLMDEDTKLNNIKQNQSFGSHVAVGKFSRVNESRNNFFHDLVDEGYTVEMQAVSIPNRAIRSAVRCYDIEGRLKSIAILEGKVITYT